MPKYIVPIKIGNELYYYERKYKYLKKYKNNRATNRYLGKEKYKNGSKLVLINDKAIKESTLQSYLYSFNGQIDGLEEMLANELPISENGIKAVFKFIEKRNEKLFRPIPTSAMKSMNSLGKYAFIVKSRYYYYFFVIWKTGDIDEIRILAEYEECKRSISIKDNIHGKTTVDYGNTNVVITLKEATEVLRGRRTGRCSFTLNELKCEISYNMDVANKVIKRIATSYLITERMIQNLESIISEIGVKMAFPVSELKNNLHRLESVLSVCLSTNLTFLEWGLKRTRDAIIDKPIPDLDIPGEYSFEEIPEGLTVEQEIVWLLTDLLKRYSPEELIDIML